MNKLLLIMRISLLFLIIGTLNIFATSSYSQSVKLDLKLNNVTLEQFFDAIKAQTEFSIVLKSSDVNLKEKVSIQARQQSVEQVLTQVLKGYNLSFEIKDKYIIIFKTEERKAAQGVPQQKKILKGIVKDEKGEPVIGASVLEKGSTNGSITDLDGVFSIQTTPESTLVISYIGYQTQELAVANRSTFDIILREDSEVLEEVVVVGYGTQKKSSLTGAVASVSPKELTKQIASNIASALQGRTPGVEILQQSGVAGADVNIVIRGAASLEPQSLCM